MDVDLTFIVVYAQLIFSEIICVISKEIESWIRLFCDYQEHSSKSYQSPKYEQKVNTKSMIESNARPNKEPIESNQLLCWLISLVCYVVLHDKVIKKLLTLCSPGPSCLNVVLVTIAGVTHMEFHCSGSWPTCMAFVANPFGCFLKDMLARLVTSTVLQWMLSGFPFVRKWILIYFGVHFPCFDELLSVAFEFFVFFLNWKRCVRLYESWRLIPLLKVFLNGIIEL